MSCKFAYSGVESQLNWLISTRAYSGVGLGVGEVGLGVGVGDGVGVGEGVGTGDGLGVTIADPQFT